MRARLVFAILTGCLAGAGAAGGCQILAQLNDLQVAGTGGAGTGGAASSSKASTTSSSTSSATSMSSSTSSGTPGCQDAGGTCTSPCPVCGDAGVCLPPCSAMGCDTTIHTQMGPSAVQCNDATCAGKTFTCSPGPYLCELDCNVSGACTGNTKLVCGDGPCRIVCTMMACGMGTTQVCGSGACDMVYAAPTGVPAPIVQQACDASCNCTQEDDM